MHAQDQTQQSGQPFISSASSNLGMQEPNQEQRLPEENKPEEENVQCVICFEDIKPNEPTVQCKTCNRKHHKSGLVRWISICYKQKHLRYCFLCRADMTWLLYEIPTIFQCSWCGEYIGLFSQRVTCPMAGCAKHFHRQELLDYKIFSYPKCGDDMREIILNEEQALALPDDQLCIQPAEMSTTISNYDLMNPYELFDSTSENESESDSN